jgi:hypothetical protein
MADFRGKMKQVDPEYLKSWDAKTNDQEALMAETMVVQKQMLDSVLALYGFTAKHTAAFKLSGDKLEITDPSIKQEFASQFTASKTQYNKMVEQVQKAAKQQQDARSRSADISH